MGYDLLFLTGCGAADSDESLWDTNEVGGGDAFAIYGQPGPLPTGPVPTGIPTGTSTGPVPTSTSTGPIPTGTSTGPVPTTTTPVPTGTTDPVPSGNSGPCALTFDFTTVTVNGSYAPRHVEAAWIETQSGTFIQTLEAFGTIRIGNLAIWYGKTFGNVVDAVTGATISSHRAHTVTWDCVDPQGAPVADGTYRVMVEFTESNAGGFLGTPTQQLSAEFQKGPSPVDFMLPDATGFRGIHLNYQ